MPRISKAGQYQWVQLVSIDDVQSFGSQQKTCTGGTTASAPGLDTQYPYDVGLEAGDEPSAAFLPGQTEMNANANFQTYFMWNSQINDQGIWVPLGALRWAAAGDDAYDSSTGLYDILSGSAPSGVFQLIHSEPTWVEAVNASSVESSCH